MAVREQLPAVDRRPVAHPSRTGRRWSRTPAVAAALIAIALQIAYPLTDGAARDALTVAVVIAFSAACLLHAAATRGPRFAVGVLLITAVPGFAVELLGVHTAIPFGGYRYTAALGGQVLGVPVVVALAWTMLAWPAAIAARRLARGRIARIAVGAWALTAADLFLDPQMVAAGYWHWQDPTPHLPGVSGVPLTNLVGWLLASVAITAGLQRLLDSADVNSVGTAGGDGLAAALYIWLWAGWSVALAIFLGLPAAAGWGALGMGAVAIPLALRSRR